MKNTIIGNLIGIALNLQIAFGNIIIFIKLILPTQERGISLHLFMSSLISFISVLQLSVYISFVSLARFIPRYFTHFVAIVNGIHCLISFSDFSLLVYKITSDFCVFILYPATLLNSLISSSNFLITSLEFSMYSVMSSQTVKVLFLLFQPPPPIYYYKRSLSMCPYVTMSAMGSAYIF